MSTINVNCVDHVLALTNTPVISSGSEYVDKIQFSFCPQWDGYGKIAVFWCEDEKDNLFYRSVIDPYSNIADIPNAVIAKDCKIHFAVTGIKESQVRTSNVLSYEIVEGSITTAVDDPDPSVYEQIITLFADAPNKVHFLIECNNDVPFRFWVGTKAEYEAVKNELPENTYCVITDDDTLDVINDQIGAINNRLDVVDNRLDGSDDRLDGLDTRLDTSEDNTTVINNRVGVCEAFQTRKANTIYSENVLIVDVDNPSGVSNQVSVADSSSIGRPDDFVSGTREVYYLGRDNILVQLTGTSTSGSNNKWLIQWNGTTWSEWNKLSGSSEFTANTIRYGEIIAPAFFGANAVSYLASIVLNKGTYAICANCIGTSVPFEIHLSTSPNGNDGFYSAVPISAPYNPIYNTQTGGDPSKVYSLKVQGSLMTMITITEDNTTLYLNSYSTENYYAQCYQFSAFKLGG